MNWFRKVVESGASDHAQAQAPLTDATKQIEQNSILEQNLLDRSIGNANHELLQVTQQAIDVFLASKKEDGQIGGIGYWQVANGYTAIALHDIWSGSRINVPTLHHQIYLIGSQNKDFINEFNDDSMWWAMCLLEMHLLTHHAHYLQTADEIWNHVLKYVIPSGKYQVADHDMEGGVMWTSRANETNVNAITTGLFSELSARLAVQERHPSKRQRLIHAAQLSLFWILRCRYVEKEFLVLDTIDLATHETKDWTFTYNTGQAMAASVAIYDAIQQHHRGSSHSALASQYLTIACNMARHAMTRPGWVEQDGTLTEATAYPGASHKPAWQNDDAVGFKSILLRSLTKLYLTLKQEDVEAELQEKISGFVQWNFQSLQTRDTNGQGQYGPWWAGPMDLPTSHSQLAVLDVMAAIHAVSEGGSDSREARVALNDVRETRRKT